MCAILGWLNHKKSLDDKKNIFGEMLSSMENRGRDSSGTYFSKGVMLGHNRLAVIDVENGKQPMEYRDYVIVYNGELYNTEEIRDELIREGYEFDTTCDTEVLLKGYVCFGKKILDKIEGIYAFGVYHKNSNSLFLARDRFGVKPLFYTIIGDNLIFASSIKAILKSGVVKARLDRERLGEILALGPSRKMGSGIFQDIYELRPGFYMEYLEGNSTIARYFSLKSKKCDDTFEEAVVKVRELLTDSIKRQMVSDVGIATLLSGGLDSSIITGGVANHMDDPLTTYSIDYEGNHQYFKKTKFTVSEDKEYIEIMRKTFHTEHKYEVITQEEVVDLLRDTLEARDYPGMIDIDSSLLWFSRKIREDYKVILSGECADEIFGGYPWFYREELCDRDTFPWINNIEIRQNILKKEIREKLDLEKIVREEYERTIGELSEEDREDKYKRLFYVNMTHFMTCLLDRKDRMTMGANLEARVPFADTKLMEYLWNLPFDYKYREDTEKYLLREAFRGIIPDEIIERKKNPYPKTHHPYFLERVTALLKERLQNKDSVLYRIFDEGALNELLDCYDDQDLPWFGQLMNKPQLIAYLYQFDLWVEEYEIEIEI